MYSWSGRFCADGRVLIPVALATCCGLSEEQIVLVDVIHNAAVESMLFVEPVTGMYGSGCCCVVLVLRYTNFDIYSR